MKLSQKGTVFLLSILGLQLAVFVALTCLLLAAEKDQLRAQHSQVTTTKLVELENRLTAVLLIMANFLLAKDRDALTQRLDRLFTEIPISVHRLEQNEWLSKEDRQALGEIAMSSGLLIEIARKCKSIVETGDATYRFIAFKRTLDNSLVPALYDIGNASDRLIQRQNADTEPLRLMQRARDTIKYGVLATFIINIVITITLVRRHNHGITNRLSLINDNINRFGSGKELLSPKAVSGNDEIASLNGTFHDMARAIDEASAKDKALFANMPVGLISCNGDGTIEQLNPRAAELLGDNTGSLVGKSFCDRLAKSIAFEKLIQNNVASLTADPSREEIVRLNGSMFPAEVTLAAFKHGGSDRYIVCLSDISDRERGERLRKEIISIVSHDLKTPLTNISCYLHLLSEGNYGYMEEAALKAVSMAHKESSRLTQLTRDLLDVASLEAGSIRLNRSIHELAEVFETSLDAVLILANAKDVELTAQTNDLTIYADGERLVQIIVNLMTNAIKYSDCGTTVRIEAETVEGGVKISVIDQGRGVPEEFRSEIFERFRQVQADDAKIGSGLGLFICKLLVESHGGQLGVDSNEGGGSRFWFILPAENLLMHTAS